MQAQVSERCDDCGSEMQRATLNSAYATFGWVLFALGVAITLAAVAFGLKFAYPFIAYAALGGCLGLVLLLTGAWLSRTGRKVWVCNSCERARSDPQGARR